MRRAAGRRPGGPFVITALAIIFGVCLTVCLSSWSANRSLARHSATATGVVVAAHQDTVRNVTVPSGSIEVTFESGGIGGSTSRTATIDVDQVLPIGQQVTLRYDTTNPSHATLAGKEATNDQDLTAAFAWFAVVSGVVFASTGVRYARWRHRTPDWDR